MAARRPAELQGGRRAQTISFSALGASWSPLGVMRRQFSLFCASAESWDGLSTDAGVLHLHANSPMIIVMNVVLTAANCVQRPSPAAQRSCDMFSAPVRIRCPQRISWWAVGAESQKWPAGQQMLHSQPLPKLYPDGRRLRGPGSPSKPVPASVGLA